MTNINDSYVRDLDLNLLRVFVVVAEEGSLTRAAARLYVTQPAVSAAVKRLSSFVGTELFARQGHGMVPTKRGAALLAMARTHLHHLVAATVDAPVFDAAKSTATVRIGLSGFLDAVLLPVLLERLADAAPDMQIVVLSVQFRTVEEMLLSGRIDFALSVADELPRSILRKKIVSRHAKGHGLVCLWDPRFAKVSRSEDSYFAQDHVVVSYAGDARGIVEDASGRARRVRLSVPGFGFVPDVVDGSNLVATVAEQFARHVVETRPHLKWAPLPFRIDRSDLELLWSRVTDNDAPSRFVRALVVDIASNWDGQTARARARRS